MAGDALVRSDGSANMLSRTAILATFAALLALAVPARAHAPTRAVSSSNWAGYAVSEPDLHLRRVAGTWVQPAVTCTPGQRRYSVFWVGLGGFHSTSNALEQIGTQVDCSSLGEAVYSAWYELVPAPPVHIDLRVPAGDTLSASVTVSGHAVKLYLADRTSGAHFARKVHADQVDVSSAEWIVEAPSSCDSTGCQPLPLANFGSASFGGANATTTAGHQGVIADPSWAATPITLSPYANDGIGASLALPGSSAAAVPGPLSATGDGFTVTYQDVPPSGGGPPPVGSKRRAVGPGGHSRSRNPDVMPHRLQPRHG
jgi:Peptidase A4 family